VSHLDNAGAAFSKPAGSLEAGATRQKPWSLNKGEIYVFCVLRGLRGGGGSPVSRVSAPGLHRPRRRALPQASPAAARAASRPS
jgi:hypothetical protein